MISKKLAGILVLVMAIAVVSGCVGQESGTQTNNSGFVNDRNEIITGNYVVFITANGFEPAELTIPAGSAVIWKNIDTKGQTVYFNDTKKGSPSINPGRSWSYQFNQTGEYPYYSSFYIALKGTIIVR